MNIAEPLYLSKKGMKELKREVCRLERERSDALSYLREIDKTDSHDNRLTRVERLANIQGIDSELAEKRITLARAKLFPRKRDALKVAIGSVVDLLDTQGRIVRYRLVESVEANPSDGRISIKSPLGQKLLNKQLQDVVEWTAGMRTNQLQLISIS